MCRVMQLRCVAWAIGLGAGSIFIACLPVYVRRAMQGSGWLVYVAHVAVNSVKSWPVL